jgi:hypothetical protein
MTKTITADFIENTAGDRLLTNGYPAQPNRILEYLASPCDGSSVTVSSGTYTFPNVTAQQGGLDTYQIITGSNIYYCPPPEAKKVVYQFTFSAYWVAAHAINHYKFYISDTEIVKARHSRSAQYIENRYQFDWTISIGDSDTPADAKFLSWTTPKHLYMMFRRYGVSNYSNHHGTYYWDGTSSNQFNIPLLSIVATT